MGLVCFPISVHLRCFYLVKSPSFDHIQLRHLKRVRKRSAGDCDGSLSSDVEMYICPSSAIGDITDDILNYFESPLRTLDVCQVKPRDRQDRDDFGRYWPVIFRPTGGFV